MKKFSKILSVALLVALVLSLGVSSAFAAEKTTLTVSSPVPGHTYTAYQLFVGDVDASRTKLSNVKWGVDVASSITYKAKASETATTFTVDTNYSPVAGQAVPQDILDYLASLSSATATDAAQGTADIISAWVTGDGTTIPATGVLENVDFGYYVVKDAYTDPTQPTLSTISTAMCQVVGPTTITPKAGTTEHKKEVLDVNDTTDPVLSFDNLIGVDADKWSKTADHDIGDQVPFKLTTTIASDYGKYDTYYLAVSDTLGAGLSLNQNTIKVYVDGELAAAYDETNAPNGYKLTVNGQTFKVEFTDLKQNAKAAANKDVVVVYTATLLDTCVIGNPGNKNESYAEYSNNPNDGQNGKSKTPTDTSVVFTFKTDVDKIDPEGNALPKAGFTLYKKVYNEAALNGKTNVAGTTPAGAKADTFPSGEFWYEVGTIEPSAAGTNFEFKGIDDGTYKLVESVTPDGYNTMDPITLVVTATEAADTNSETGYSITFLDAGNDDFAAAPDGNGGTVTFDRVKAADKAVANGEIYSEIVNNSGTQLPSTGGIGTTIFYVVGGVLVLAAIILLVTKKRMSE